MLIQDTQNFYVPSFQYKAKLPLAYPSAIYGEVIPPSYYIWSTYLVRSDYDHFIPFGCELLMDPVVYNRDFQLP